MGIRRFTKYFMLIFTVIIILYRLDYDNSATRFKDLLKINKISDLKYLLVWTSMKADPIKYFGEGTSTVINRKCSYTNCFVSSNRQLFKDVAMFDVILFHGPELTDKINPSLLPQSRSPLQKYVFVSMESSANHPFCNKMYNSYFNWTWTYKLNSDEIYGYIIIRNKEGKVIGPKEEMHWEKVKTMMPINDNLKAKLSTKKIAAAWFVSSCGAPSGRDLIAKQLQFELFKYDMQIDIYGKCGTKDCPKGNMKECLWKLETDYYFYLSFENSFAEDYVTEKLLHALQHYAVPVVYGGANYTRYDHHRYFNLSTSKGKKATVTKEILSLVLILKFAPALCDEELSQFMPDGIYLTAQKSRVKELAKEMVNIINDKQKYYDFFKWHNHYSYYDILESSDTDKYCKFCAAMNNKEQILRTSVYENFRQWWNPQQHECH